MEHKVKIESTKIGTFLSIDGKFFGHFNAIPRFIQSELNESQTQTIHDFFDVDNDPHKDAEKALEKLEG